MSGSLHRTKGSTPDVKLEFSGQMISEHTLPCRSGPPRCVQAPQTDPGPGDVPPRPAPSSGCRRRWPPVLCGHSARGPPPCRRRPVGVRGRRLACRSGGRGGALFSLFERAMLCFLLPTMTSRPAPPIGPPSDVTFKGAARQPFTTFGRRTH